MENIYKIKIRTNPDTTGLYPSERRYSASTVLGLSVVHLALGLTALLMAMLSFSNYHIYQGSQSLLKNETSIEEETTIPTNTSEENQPAENATAAQFVNITYRNCALSPCIMSIGAFLAGVIGLLAWKRWYIDQNIRWFFLASLLSTVLSAVCVCIMFITLIAEYEKFSSEFPHILTDIPIKEPNKPESILPSIKFILSLNIMIACLLELIWSSLSAKVAYAGMRNTYPDDIIISKSRGKIEVNTVHKGSKKAPPIMPPDILNHFPNSSKLAKYLPRIEDGGNLPKTESSSEYQERVRKFLSGNMETKSEKSCEISDIDIERIDKSN